LLVKKLSRGLIAVLEVHLDIEGTTLIRGNSGQEFGSSVIVMQIINLK
jgi:hypothetical protein